MHWAAFLYPDHIVFASTKQERRTFSSRSAFTDDFIKLTTASDVKSELIKSDEK